MSHGIQETDFCPACKWQGSWDGTVCPECGAMTVVIEWAKCRVDDMKGEFASVMVITSECKCGEHGPGGYVMPSKALLDRGINSGDEFWIVANLDGVQGQILTLEQARSRGKSAV